MLLDRAVDEEGFVGRRLQRTGGPPAVQSGKQQSRRSEAAQSDPSCWVDVDDRGKNKKPSGLEAGLPCLIRASQEFRPDTERLAG